MLQTFQIEGSNNVIGFTKDYSCEPFDLRDLMVYLSMGAGRGVNVLGYQIPNGFLGEILKKLHHISIVINGYLILSPCFFFRQTNGSEITFSMIIRKSFFSCQQTTKNRSTTPCFGSLKNRYNYPPLIEGLRWHTRHSDDCEVLFFDNTW